MKKLLKFSLLLSILVTLPATAKYSAVILHPDSGFSISAAYGVSGSQQVGYGVGGSMHALLWSGTAASCEDLNPSGFDESYAYGVFGGRQVGYGIKGGYAHALLWSGTAVSCEDLHPSGFNGSCARGVSADKQVGYGWGSATGNKHHALLWTWTGTSADCFDLNPSGFAESEAYGVSGRQLVGRGWGSATGNKDHALLWTWMGTSADCFDLNPSGFDYSYARGVSDGQQVGYGVTGGSVHALLWSGTAISYVDLNPVGFYRSYAYGVSGGWQVGYGIKGGYARALLWTGTAASYVDLHKFLPAEYINSVAESIDSAGNIAGRAGTANSVTHAILWVLNRPPIADAGPDQTFEQKNYNGSEVPLRGSGSTDPDSTPGTNDDIVSFDWYEEGSLLGSGEIIKYTFPLGTHIVTLLVTDSAGQTDIDDVNIVIQDTTAPDVKITSPEEMTYQNTQGSVSVVYTVEDRCDPNPKVEVFLDGEAFAEASIDLAKYLGETQHTMKVVATDRSSNVGEDSVTFKVVPKSMKSFLIEKAEMESTSGIFIISGRFELPQGYQRAELDRSGILYIQTAGMKAKDKVAFIDLDQAWTYMASAFDNSLGQGMDIEKFDISWSLPANSFYIKGKLSLAGACTIILEIPVAPYGKAGSIAGKETIAFKIVGNIWYYGANPTSVKPVADGTTNGQLGSGIKPTTGSGGSGGADDQTNEWDAWLDDLFYFEYIAPSEDPWLDEPLYFEDPATLEDPWRELPDYEEPGGSEDPWLDMLLYEDLAALDDLRFYEPLWPQP